MILVDTSIWVQHLRASLPAFVELLEGDRVLTHSFVVGELALSGLVNRREIIDLLQELPRATEASHSEAMETVARWSLDGRGVGWVDTHLLAATLLSGARLWTADRSLAAVAAAAEAVFDPDGPR